jgi:UPF0755 protein
VTGERKDKDLRASARRAADARGGRSSRRAFRPLRWAWLLLLVALAAPAFDLFFPAGFQPPRQRRTVVIERGQTLHEIARDLQRAGVIKSQVGFLVLARAMQLDRSVKAGQYSFKLGITVPALLRALDRGMYGLNLVTIPEGLMIRETARIIELQVGISAAAIDSLSRDHAMLDSLEIGAPSLEGWLAPDSYEWLPGTAPEVVLRTMVTRTRERVQRATAGYDSLPLGMNQHEVLTLASIVEAESRANDERPRIARVYLNRLERGMLLQADPTVGYALGRSPRSRLLFKDLRVESPYNTYRHEGLPPGPICSPGESAIQAVMNATPGTTDLYFVANGKGRHIFAPTYQKHLENIALVKSRMRAEALASARTSPPARAASAPVVGGADDDIVVGGEPGDSGVVHPSGKAPAPATPPAPAPSTPASGITAQGTTAKSQSPPIANLTRLSPTPTSSGSTSASPSSKPATPSAPLKGTLLVPRGSATVASSTPGSVEVVRKKTPIDTTGAKKPASKPATTTSTATKSTAGAPASTKSSTGAPATTKSTAGAPASTKSTASAPAAAKSTAKPASDTSAKKSSGKSKPAPAETNGAKSDKDKKKKSSEKDVKSGSTSEKKPKPKPKPAAKDTTR